MILLNQFYNHQKIKKLFIKNIYKLNLNLKMIIELILNNLKYK